MANYYTQGTVAPYLPLTKIHRDLIDLNMYDEEYEDPALEILAKQIWGEDPYDRSLGLRCERVNQDEYYLFAEESLGEADLAFLEWLAKTDPEMPAIEVEFAHSCSKLRPGSFGGGAWFITPDHTDSMHTSMWLSEVRKLYADAIVED